MKQVLHRCAGERGAAWRACLALVAVAILVASAVMLGFAGPATAVASGTAGDVVVTGATAWQYRDDNQQPAEGWRTSAAVSDPAWKTAVGSFGAKRGAIADLGGGHTPQNLLVQYIDGTDDDIPVYYFRTTFNVENPAVVTGIEGAFAYDDAATIYVNGVRIAGGDDEGFDANGYGGSNAGDPKEASIGFTDIASLNLKATGNVVAVELHNGRASSSDIYFDLKKLTLTTGAAEADIKGVEFAVGSTEGERNFNWLGTTSGDAVVEVAPKPAGYQVGDAFPEDAATTVAATASASQRAGYRSFKATVTGIKGGTTYLYRVGNAEKWSETAEFTTEEQGAGKAFNFLFAGDPQIGASGNAANDQEGWTSTLDLAAPLKADFLVSAGDQVNSSSKDSEFDAYYAPEALASMPQATTVGNHDNGARHTDYNNMPNMSGLGSTAERAGAQSGDYWFTYNGVLFMDLNSNNRTTSEHKQFMEQAIAANPNATWKIVTFHHSTFSLASHYTDDDIIQRRKELPQVFSDLGIDVVLMGHDHYFTRTYLMEGTTPVVPEGHDVQAREAAPTEAVNPEKGQVLYLTANSASGSKYYALNGTLGANALPGYVAAQDQSRRESITNVSVSNDALTLDTYYSSGSELEKMDTFTIRRVGAPAIALPGEDGAVSVKVGEAFDPMAGVSATDALGTDLTDAVSHVVKDAAGTEVDAVDTSAEGTFTVEYAVTDAYGSSAAVTLTVNVVEPAAPENPTDPENPADTQNPTNPENPGQPTDPTAPTGTQTPNQQPGTPSTSGTSAAKPATTGSNARKKGRRTLPKTGDAPVLAVSAAVATAATVAIAAGVIRQRRRG